MTRPKHLRQEAKRAKNPFAGLPVLKEARVPLSPSYTLELTLHEAPDGNTALWCGWDPHPPGQAEEDALSDRIDAALAPFLEFAFSRFGRPALIGEA